MATAAKAPRKKSTRRAKPTPMRSLRRSSETAPFLTFRVTVQSVYWLILCVVVLGLGIWVMYLNAKVQHIYDQIEINNTITDMRPPAHMHNK